MALKFIDIYNRCKKEGKLVNRNGLCSELMWTNEGTINCDPDYDEMSDILELFKPIRRKDEVFTTRGTPYIDRALCTAYWATNTRKTGEQNIDFGQLRKTILLFCAAINNEL